MLADWYYWVGVAGFAFIAGSEACANFMLPQYLTSIGFSQASSGCLTAAFAAGIVIGRFFAAIFFSAHRPRNVILFCMPFALASAAVLGLRSVWLLGPVLFLFGLTFSSTWPSYFAHLCTYYPRHKAYLAGGSGLANSIGVGGSFFISGWLADAFEPAVSVAAGAVLILAWLALFLVMEKVAGKRIAAGRFPA